jgi:hypothetical protein
LSVASYVAGNLKAESLSSMKKYNVLNIPKKSKVRERHEFICFAKNIENLSLRLTNCKPQVFDVPHRCQGLSDTMLVLI